MTETVAVVFLIGRVVFALPFLTSGVAHFQASEQMAGYARAMGAPLASLGGWPAGLWLVVASLSVGLGVWPDVGALMIALWGIVTAFFIHGWWKYDEEQQQTQRLFFWRNIMFVGAAIALFAVFVAFGPDLRYSLTEALFDF